MRQRRGGGWRPWLSLIFAGGGNQTAFAELHQQIHARTGSLLPVLWQWDGWRVQTTADGAAASGGFGRLSAGGKGQPWSTLDLGKGTGTGPVDGWKNSSHQGLTAAAPEPTRGLGFKAGDKVGWRLLVRQNLWEICASPSCAPCASATSRPLVAFLHLTAQLLMLADFAPAAAAGQSLPA